MKEIKVPTEDIKLPVVGGLLNCCARKCKRKILVERALIGTDHTSEIFVTCWDCLNEEAKKEAKRRYKLE